MSKCATGVDLQAFSLSSAVPIYKFIFELHELKEFKVSYYPKFNE